MKDLTLKQIQEIKKNYQKLKSIRKTAKLLNIKENQVYKIIRVNPKTNEIELKETKPETILPIISKHKLPDISKLIDTLILKLLKELKLKYKDLKPREISQAVSSLLQGKVKLEGLNLEDNKANLIAQVYGNMENMLTLYNEIKDTTSPEVINIKASEVRDLELNKLEELAKIT
jgi:hypothetical protein